GRGALRGPRGGGPRGPRAVIGRGVVRGRGPEGVRAGRARGRRAEGPGGDGGPQGPRRGALSEDRLPLADDLGPADRRRRLRGAGDGRAGPAWARARDHG